MAMENENKLGFETLLVISKTKADLKSNWLRAITEESITSMFYTNLLLSDIQRW